MSTDYTFYLIGKIGNDFEYCGPYVKKDKNFEITPIYSTTRSFIEPFDDYFYHVDKIPKEIIDYFKNNYSDDLETRDCRMINLSRLEKDFPVKSMIKEAYIEKNIVKRIEVVKDISVDDLLDDYYDYVISPTEYKELTKEEQKNYVHYSWLDNNDNSVKVNSVVDFCYNWFAEGLDIYSNLKFKDLRREDLYLFCVIS